MNNNWFRWEREASPHLLLPTLEVFYAPLKKYNGVSAPTMILIFKKGIVTWCIKEKDFIDYGSALLNIYQDPNKEKKMVCDIKRALWILKKVEKEIDKINLVKLSDVDLIKLHQKLYKAFLDYYTMGAIGTPLSFAAEIKLKNNGLSDNVINSLVTPDEISYVAQADKYLLRTKNIKGFISRYFWIDNNYLGTKIINDAEVKNKLNELKDKSTTAAASLSSRKIISGLNKESKRLIELLKHYSLYKDNRKKEILIYLHFIDLILEEIARRKNLKLEQVRASLPTEVTDLLNGKLAKLKLDKRLDFCTVVWQKNQNWAKIFTGEKAKKWEKITLQQNNLAQMIQGRTACPGKVQGRVRVLLKAEECKKFKRGEVLVTFMTSPDFMKAIRKASAIVTNLGGVTSHAAIISRELNIPCIVGTKIATQVLKDGDLVEVDANKGIVKVL